MAFTPLPELKRMPSQFSNLFASLSAPTGATPGTGHWDYPDYAGLLDKWMQPYQQQYQGDMAAQKAMLDTNQKLAADRYSQGPNSTLERFKKQEAYGALRHGMTVDQAQHQHDTNVRSLTNALAARGILSSGEREYQNSEEATRFGNMTKAEQEQYKQEQYGYQTQRADASNQLLDYLRGLQQAFADAQRQGLSGLSQQKQQIADLLAQLYRPTWADDTPQNLTENPALAKYANSFYGTQMLTENPELARYIHGQGV